MEDEVLKQKLNHLVLSIVDVGETIGEVTRANSSSETINPLITEALKNSDPNDDTT